MHEIKNGPSIESECGINEYLICMSSVMREGIGERLRGKGRLINKHFI